MCFSIHIDSAVTDKTKIQIEGQLLVGDASKLRVELLEIFTKYNEADIYLKNVNRIDTAALQVLLALKKSAVSAQKVINLHFDTSAYMQNILIISGFAHTFQNQ
jgi:anti-anti-sigma regulatory factor